MTKKEWIKKYALLIRKRKLSPDLNKKLQCICVKYNLPMRLLKSIVLIETAKRPWWMRSLEKVLITLDNYLNLGIDITVGVTQIKISKIKQQKVNDFQILDTTALFLKQIISEVGLNIVKIGYLYNGSKIYGLILKEIYQNL